MNKMLIGFSRPNKTKILSSIIMLVESTPFSHAYIKIWSDKYQRFLIYQASGLQVNFMNEDIFLEHNVVIDEYEIDISDDTKTSVMVFAIDQCGKPYGIKELFGFLIVKIYKLFGKTIDNPFADGNVTYVCSELVATALEDCLDEDLPEKPDDMTPKDLYDYVRSKLLKL